MTGSPTHAGSASIPALPDSSQSFSVVDLSAPFDVRMQRGLDQALRLAVGALRVPLALAALQGPDRSARYIRIAESGVWDSIDGTPLGQALADQVIGAVRAA